MKRKIFRVLKILSFLIALLQVYAYHNLMISYEYEVIQSRIHIEVTNQPKFADEINQKEILINHQKSETKICFIISLMVFIILVFLDKYWYEIKGFIIKMVYKNKMKI